MGKAAAKKGDKITASDTHNIQPPSGQPVLTPGHPFSGILDDGLSTDVNIMGKPAATVDSTATNTPPHVAIGGTFVNPPSNKGKIAKGSTTVFINKKPAARSGDTAMTCNDPNDLPIGTVQAEGTVNIGD